jgi:hypothetical protein
VVKGVTQNSPYSSAPVQSPQINLTISEVQNTGQGLGVSSGKITENRGKTYTQLATLKQLHEDGILTLSHHEFQEQRDDSQCQCWQSTGIMVANVAKPMVSKSFIACISAFIDLMTYFTFKRV